MTAKPNPFTSMPFPNAGGQYRHEKGALVAEHRLIGLGELADAHDAAEAEAETETDSGETTPPQFARNRKSHR